VSGNVKQLSAGSKFNIETPLGTVAIRDNKFSVETHHNVERGEFVLIVHNKDGKVDIISGYIGSFEYSRSNIAEKGFNIDAPHQTSESIPPAHIIVIRLSKLDPHYDRIINARKNYPPAQSRSTQPELEPVVTPEDKEVMIISPNTNFSMEEIRAVYLERSFKILVHWI